MFKRHSLRCALSFFTGSLACLTASAQSNAEPSPYLGDVAAPSSESTPDLPGSRVSIPYSELKTLLAAAQPKPEKKEQQQAQPPVKAVLFSANYQVALDGAQVTGSAVYVLQDFTNEWSIMPLLGTDAQIVSVEPADLQIIIRDGHYALVTNHPGKQTVTMRFAARMSTSADGAQLRLPIVPASINTLTVTGVPQNQALRIPNATQFSSDKASASFALAAQDHLELDLVSQKSLAAPIPSAWKIEPQSFVRLADGKLAYQARVAAHADNGSGLSMDLKLPADAYVSSITGDDLASWQIKTADGQAEVAHIQWQTRDTLRREVEIQYDMPQPLTAAQWSLASPQVVNGESSPPLYLVALQPGLEITPTSANAIPRQIPQWLSDLSHGVNFLVFVGDTPIQAKWLPLVVTPRAVVETAHASTQIVTDGAILTDVEYSIQHETAFAWRLTLPDNSELLSSYIDGQTVNPIDCGNHAVEFSLPAGQPSNKVKLAYTSKAAAFKPVSGDIEINLPRTDLLTSKLQWDLHIPEAYEVAAFEGKVQPDTGAAQGDPRTILLHREIFKSESPTAQLFYQKPDSNN